MKHLFLLTMGLFFAISLSAQPWLENLPKGKTRSEMSFFDYQKAFNDYWKDYDIVGGYYFDEDGVKHKAPGWKQFKRWEWNWEPQVDAKTGQFPQNSPYEIMKNYNVKNRGTSTKSANWTSLGPSSSGGGYAGVGRINCVQFHPTDLDTYWIGAPAGGLWVTTNNGISWTCLTDSNPVLGVSDIVIPSDYETSQTIYIATGDRDAGDNRSIGVLKSTDAGATWQTTGLSYQLSQNVIISRLLLDPNDDNTIIAATTIGVYKTTDGGETWNTQLTNHSFSDMEYNPGNFDVLYGSASGGKIYTSFNGGETWDITLNVGASRTEMAVTEANSDIVYAIVAASNNGLYGIYKSTDSGETFEQVFNGLTSGNNLLGWYDGTDGGGQGWYDLSIAASPLDAQQIAVGGVNSWQSSDGGETWEMATHWYGGGYAQAVHADKHMLKYRSNGDLFECNDGGIYFSNNDGVSGSWTDKTNGMVISQMYRLGVAQSVADETITGLQDNGTKLNYNNGSWDDVKGGDGMECIIDYTDVNTQYGTYVRGQISRTTNHWNSSTDIEPSDAGYGAWVTPYIMDPFDHNTLYAGYADLWKTTNQGNSWTKISTVNANSYKLRSLAIAHSNTDVIYMADPYTIWKTENGGDNWENITSGLPGNFINYITVKHDDENTLWVAMGGYDGNGIFESTDGGDSWVNISDGLPELPVYTVVQNVLEVPTTDLYVGTEVGIYYKNGDNDWVPYNTNLPNVKIDELEIYYDYENIDNCRLRAATYGRGLWESPLVLSGNYTPVLAVSEAENITQTSATLIGEITYNFGVDITESGFVYSTDPDPQYGEEGVTVVSTDPVTSSGEFELDIDGLNAGTYYYFSAFAISENGTGYSVSKSFNTNCSTLSDYPYLQEFSYFELPPCWQNIDNNEGGVWLFDNPEGFDFNSTTADNGFAIMDSRYYGYGFVQDADLVSPEFDFTETNNVVLNFEHHFASYATSFGALYCSNDGGTTWSEIEKWMYTTENPEVVSINVSGWAAGHENVLFKWKYYGSNSNYWAIDDISILLDGEPEYSITFNISHQGTGNPVSEATIVINESEVVTDDEGSAHVYLPDGQYQYSISANGFNELTNANLAVDGQNEIINIALNYVGIGNMTEDMYSVYPNPTNGVLNVELDDEYNVSIIKADGAIVISKTINKKGSFDLANYSKGIYFIQITSEKYHMTHKIILK